MKQENEEGVCLAIMCHVCLKLSMSKMKRSRRMA